MLKLTDIKKDYVTGDSCVHALRGVSLEFRKSEFVSILGQSGCGKTTLLNIIGGLDQYTSGDLIINGKSTKQFKDRDWDTYRNHSVGFVFQSYNLIPHQSVLANVELALTLSGVSKEERRKRATEALITVGLGEQIHKRPNQLSGGQMQRVAIARALVNDPDILLADEPTGALDSETSVQIMELLKAISNDKLIIMVTHNPDLAKEYSTRIINLLDGHVVSDSDPYNSEADTAEGASTTEDVAEKEPAKPKKEKKTFMSFLTALSLSLTNLLTKKGRTFLTSFAGSIGIIGIALILSVSSGVNAYITSVEENTMSSYPLEINESSVDTMSVLASVMANKGVENPEPNTVYSNEVMATIMDSVTSSFTTNNLTDFKKYIDGNSDFQEHTTDIKYIYSAKLNTYKIMDSIEKYRPTLNGISGLLGEIFGDSMPMTQAGTSMMGGNAFTELVGDSEYIASQYNKLYGNFPTKENEVVLIVDSKQQVSDFVLYTLGIKDTTHLENYIRASINGETYEIPNEPYSFEQICGYKFKVLPDSQKYKLEGGKIVERAPEEIIEYLDSEDAMTLEIVGIVTPKEEGGAVLGAIGYTSALMTKVIAQSNANPLIDTQIKNTTTDLLTGLPFAGFAPDCTYIKAFISQSGSMGQNPGANQGFGDVSLLLNMADAQLLMYLRETVMRDTEAAKLLTIKTEGGTGLAPYGGYTVEDIDTIILPGIEAIKDPQIKSFAKMLHQLSLWGTPVYDTEGNVTGMVGRDESGENFIKVINTMLYENENYSVEQAHSNALKKLGYVDFDKPTRILIYPKDFEAKDVIKSYIDEYNGTQTKDEDKITYTDTVALLMDSVTTIVDAISYVLVAFVAISLIVSSIMIGIITYISVLERTKEIGILRAIGASKRDISRVFNAETLIVGFAAGVIGIVVSLFFIVIINIILNALTGIAELRAVLPWGAAIILVLISMGLTFIAGLFPARMASKKDPVIALRTE